MTCHETCTTSQVGIQQFFNYFQLKGFMNWENKKNNISGRKKITIYESTIYFTYEVSIVGMC
jgi:hypothetical protein